MKYNLKSLTIILALVSVSSACFSGQGSLLGSGKITKEVRDVKNYTGVSVSSGIELSLQMDNTEKVEIEAPQDLLPKVFTEVHGGVLEIGYRDHSWHLGGHKRIRAYVSAKVLESIKSSSGASVVGMNLISGETMDLRVSSGASLKVNLKETSIQARASSGAEMEISGNSNKIDASSSSGASIKASDLSVLDGKAEGSSGSEIRLKVSKSLYASASSGASIRYIGNPTLVNRDKSSGGSIQKEEE